MHRISDIVLTAADTTMSEFKHTRFALELPLDVLIYSVVTVSETDTET